MYSFKADIPIKEFTEFVEGSSFATIQQTEAWSRLKGNWKSSFCGVYKDNELKGVALILMRTLMPGFVYAYCPRGPIMDFAMLTLCVLLLTEQGNFVKRTVYIF